MPWSIVRPHALIASVGDQLYAFPVEAIGQVVHMAELSTTAGCPKSVEGFLNLRGALVPVLSLRRLLDLPDTAPGLYSPLIVLQRSGHNWVALRADAVHEVALLPDAFSGGLRSLAATDSYNSCARASFTLHERDVVLLAPELLFQATEEARLADLRRDAQRRLDSLAPAAE